MSEETKITRKMLADAVDKGELTQSDADEIWDREIRKQATADAVSTIENKNKSTSQRSKLETEIQKYVERIPDLAKEGSDSYERVRKEAEHLVYDMGYEEGSLHTTLVALRSAYGKVGDIKVEEEDPEPTTGQESTGVIPTDVRKKDNESNESAQILKGLKLTEDEHKYYDDLIKKKVMKDWSEVKETLKFANTNLRRRYGAQI